MTLPIGPIQVVVADNDPRRLSRVESALGALLGERDQLLTTIPADLPSLIDPHADPPHKRPTIVFLAIEGPSDLKALEEIKASSTTRPISVVALIDGSESDLLKQAYELRANACVPRGPDLEATVERVAKAGRFFIHETVLGLPGSLAEADQDHRTRRLS